MDYSTAVDYRQKMFQCQTWLNSLQPAAGLCDPVIRPLSQHRKKRTRLCSCQLMKNLDAAFVPVGSFGNNHLFCQCICICRKFLISMAAVKSVFAPGLGLIFIKKHQIMPGSGVTLVPALKPYINHYNAAVILDSVLVLFLLAKQSV